MRIALIATFLFLSPTLSHSQIDINLAKKLGYGNYMSPIKVSNQEQFLYIHSLLLDHEISAQKSYQPLISDKFMQLKVQCNTVGAMLTTYDFLKINQEFTVQSVISSYENNQMLRSLIVELRDDCRAVTKK